MLRMAFCLLILLSLDPHLIAGKKNKKKKKSEKVEQTLLQDSVLKGMTYRSIGPYRGGRSAAVTGVPGKPMTFYFGAAGGGVWVTHDGGSNWSSISDGFFGGSIGAVAVSEWDPNVIYVGGGEKTVRGNVSHGYGLWKSVDAGKTWKQMGLKDSRRISRIRIHPRNPDLIYVAAMGHLFGPNEERGIYRSKDGGESFEKVKAINNEVGAVDLVMDPNNPRVLYGSFWRILRTPYSLESGGEGSSLWKSTDGGDTWEDLSDTKGFPKGLLGIIGVSVSPVDSNLVWAIVENEKGGVFRSGDGGKSWTKVNTERSLRQRAWYYTRIYADTKDANTVYVLNVRFWKSTDGGKTFKSISTPHGDHHDLWIDPDNNQRMVIGDDGGAQVTYDGGKNWSTYHNQPTAQFYRVTTDNHFPYRIYVAQQDNSTLRIAHRTEGWSIGERDWEPTAGGESGHIAPHPEDPDVVYGGSYGGFLTRLNHRTGENRQVQVWPDNPMGHGAAELKWRFQWNFPIIISPHDPNVIYTAGQAVFKSTDEGQSWESISADMTRNDKSKQGPSGGPITKDNTSVEYYCTIFSLAESTHEQGVIWTGSDDGVMSITRDGGANWSLITPKDLPEWTQINSIEIDPFNKGGLYVAGTRYKLDDFTPYLYHTKDYGKTWRRIDKGIDRQHFTRVIRADPDRQGLLYAGTESGMYISFNDGESWQPFQLNLPVVPITDLAIKDKDLVVATQGRSLWILDDLSPLHDLKVSGEFKSAELFQPRDTWRIGGRSMKRPGVGENLPGGVLVHFYMPEDPKGTEDGAEGTPLMLEFLESDGTLIRSFATDLKPKDAEGEKASMKAKKGFNRFVWNLRYASAKDFPKMIVWSGSMNGPRAVPGKYKVRMTYGETVVEKDFTLKPDPRSSATQADLEAQFNTLLEIRDKLTEANEAIGKIRKAKKQISALIKPLKDDEAFKAVVEKGEALTKAMGDIEKTLYQTKNQSRQDPLNFPIRLTDKLAGVGRVVGTGSWKPTDQSLEVQKLLTAEIDAALAKLKKHLGDELDAFNTMVNEAKVPAIRL